MAGERILDHPVLGALPAAATLTFTYGDRALSGRAGDTLAAALWAAGVRGTRPGHAAGAALYCGVGHCSACRLTVDGVQGVRACLVALRAGMRVEPDPGA